MANGDDASFLDQYQVQPSALADTSFLDKYAVKQAQPDAITNQSKAAATAAGVQNPGVSTPPLKSAMEAAGAYEQARELRLAEAEHRAMQSPTPFTNAATVLYPAAELPGAIASGGLKALAKGVARGAGKMLGGAAIGSGVGGGVGEIVGHPREGAEIGATVGGIGAPFVPDAWFSRAPYGLNRVILGEEGLANARSASKLAQRNADIAAGFKKVPFEPDLPTGTSTTSSEAVSAIPESALPAIAKGAMSSVGDVTSTGAMPAAPLGTPEAEPVDPVTAAIKQGIAAKIPVRMPKTANEPTAIDTAAMERGIRGSTSKPSGRLVLSPEEARTQAIMQGIARQRASENGMQYAAGMRPAGGGRVPATPTATPVEEMPARGSSLLEQLKQMSPEAAAKLKRLVLPAAAD